MTTAEDAGAVGGARLAGGIPVRNLWLLMLYASDLYRHLGRANVAVETGPDEIPDLVARLLIDLVERRLRKNLSLGYVPRERTLDRVRGRIDCLGTERGMLLSRGKVACRFEELTVDTARNRYVRAALQSLSRLVERPDLRRRLRSLVGTLDSMGVSQSRPPDAEVLGERLGRHDGEDALMLDAARLAFELALPTEDADTRALLAPDRDVVWLRRLFEKAVARFYSVAIDPAWKVHPGRTMRWPAESCSPGALAILPTMKTDVTLDNVSEGKRIIVDTKFNRIVVPGMFGASRCEAATCTRSTLTSGRSRARGIRSQKRRWACSAILRWARTTTRAPRSTDTACASSRSIWQVRRPRYEIGCCL